MPKCPVCGAELIEVGYPVDFFQEYRCPNGCKFKPPISWKVYNTFATVLTILLFGILTLTFSPVIIYNYIKNLRRVKA